MLYNKLLLSLLYLFAFLYSLKLDNAVISEGLVKFSGVLYGKSGAMIDYAGGVASIGKIDKLAR